MTGHVLFVVSHGLWRALLISIFCSPYFGWYPRGRVLAVFHGLLTALLISMFISPLLAGTLEGRVLMTVRGRMTMAILDAISCWPPSRQATIGLDDLLMRVSALSPQYPFGGVSRSGDRSGSSQEYRSGTSYEYRSGSFGRRRACHEGVPRALLLLSPESCCTAVYVEPLESLS